MMSDPDRVWLNAYPAGVPPSIEGEIDRWASLADMIEQRAEIHRDRVAFSCLGGSLRYAEVWRLARAVAGYLASVGVGAGDRVAIMMPNCLQYPVTMFGVLIAGAVVVNVNPLYTPRELTYQLKDSGAVAVVVIDLMAPTVAASLAGTDVRHVVTTGMGDLLGGPRGWLVSALARKRRKVGRPLRSIPGAVPLPSALRRGRRHGFTRPPIGPGDLAFLQYTGGTTGVAKGAMLTHRNIVANVLQSSIWLGHGLGPGPSVNLTLLPMYHVFSLTACALTFFVLGGESALFADPRNVAGMLRTMKGRDFQCLCGTNTLFANLLESEAFRARDFSKLRLVVSGGMAMQRGLAERWFAVTGAPITEGYGLTESSPVLTVNPIDLQHPELMRFTGAVGLPVPSTDIRMRRPDGQWCALGEVGELCARGPQIMRGYWNRPVETAQVLDRDGWLSTGDVGVMDERGFVRIVERLKDVIIVSGFNVYPTEIEEVVALHPGVRDCAAMGVAHETAGERIRLIVIARDEGVTRGDIIGHCRRHLTGYKVPTIVVFTQEPLPRSNVGKLLRRALPDHSAASMPDASPSRGGQAKVRSLAD